MFVTPAYAQTGGAAGAPDLIFQFLPFILIFVIMYFLILRPQMKRQKDLQAKIGGIKKGDQVLTGGGFVAKVIKVDDHYADLELGPNVRVKALKSTIADVIPPGGVAPAND